MKSTITYLFAVIIIFISCGKEESLPTKTEPNFPQSPFTETIQFPSLDSVTITADHYFIDRKKPIIILSHRLGWSRGEYIDIADSLNKLGFNCLAIDLRTGGATVNGKRNGTYYDALSKRKIAGPLNARQDIEASIEWANNYYNKNVILWGSMDAASWSLIIAKDNYKVDQVITFSPGEYINGLEVKPLLRGLYKPVFLTSKKSEAQVVTEFYNVINSTNKVQFIPNSQGLFGSSNLWPGHVNNAEYWVAVKSFLGV